MSQLGTAMALVLVLEGAAWALFPDAMRRLMSQALSLDSAQLRQIGLVATALGLGLLVALRGMAGS